MHKVSISPVTRANAVGTATVYVEEGKVVEAESGASIFKGFEIIMAERDPWDAPYLTQRICGICSSAHALASCLALEAIAGAEPPPNGILLRNIIFGLDLLQNHIRHFYMLGLWDWASPPDRFPFKGGYTKGFRFSSKETEQLRQGYWQAADQSRLAHEALTLLGGKVPHQHGIVPGGATLFPEKHVREELRRRLQKIRVFVEKVYLPDALLLQSRYKDYLSLGVRKSGFLSSGCFPLSKGKGHHFPAGVLLDDGVEAVGLNGISESLEHSWFQGEGGDPWVEESVPDPNREGAYSWVKAPRYRETACEGGPLARRLLQGEGPRRSSTMDRIVARAREALKVARLLEVWLDELMPGKPARVSFKIPASGRGVGAVDAMRGPLSHWVTLKGGRISSYQIITPSAWNFSPRDGKGRPGPVEEALVGTPVEDVKEPIEVGRILRSFDPCYSCAAHVVDRTRGEAKLLQV